MGYKLTSIICGSAQLSHLTFELSRANASGLASLSSKTKYMVSGGAEHRIRLTSVKLLGRHACTLLFLEDVLFPKDRWLVCILLWCVLF